VLTLVCALTLFHAPLAPLPPARPAALQERPDVYDESADGARQIRAALAIAEREHKRVLVQWGANWCGWCIKLHGLLTSDRELARKVLYEYEVVHVDIGRWDKHTELAAGYGVDLKGNGVPFWTILDGDGTLVANQPTGVLEKDGAHDPAKVMEVLVRHQAPYPQAQELLDAALARAREHDRRLWVSFGAPWCGWCRRLEGWVRSEAAAPLIARDFEFLKIDVERTIGGQALLERTRGPEAGGIPWWAFLSGDGALLADSGKGRENLGCPWTDEELARFQALLGQVARRLDGPSIAELVGSLRAERQRQEAREAERQGGAGGQAPVRSPGVGG